MPSNKTKFVSKTDRVFYKLDRERIWKQQDGVCFYCARSISLKEATLDHVNPIKNVKYHSTANTVVSCGFCNKTKGHSSLEEFKESIHQNEFRDIIIRVQRRARLAEFRLDLKPKGGGSFRRWERYWLKRGRWSGQIST